MNDEVITATLAGLLHDIGKFAQRSGLFRGSHAEIGAQLVESWRGWLPAFAWDDVGDAVAGHHDKGRMPQKRVGKIIRVADQLVAGERRTEAISRSDPAETPLAPILSRVVLASESAGVSRWYSLRPLELDRATLFPQDAATHVNPAGYAQHWKAFAQDLADLEGSGPVDSDVRLSTVLSLMRKYLWCVPSATPWKSEEDERTFPDVSLYDHAKVTAATAACLELGLSDDELDSLYQNVSGWQSPIALLVRGDLSGIQDFIFRITRPEAEGEFEDVAKRLRGRSAYLSLLGDVVADLVTRRLGLSGANVLFLGGGRFDLLAPIGPKTATTLLEIQSVLEDWLLQQFTGVLGLQIGTAEVRPADLSDMRRVYTALEASLQEGKQRKWERYLLNEEYHVVATDEYHACRVCHTTPLADPGICSMCEQQARLGKALPHATHLALVYGVTPAQDGLWLQDFQQALGVQIGILDDADTARLLEQLARKHNSRSDAIVYQLNDTAFLRKDAPPGVGMGFRFMANAAPVARQPLRVKGGQLVAKGEVLHFDAVAHLSTGAELLGVLKADVDHLGLLLSEGLDDGKPGGMRPTISRLATASSAVEMFFAGWINQLCQEVSQEWRNAQTDGGADARHLGQTQSTACSMSCIPAETTCSSWVPGMPCSSWRDDCGRIGQNTRARIQMLPCQLEWW